MDLFILHLLNGSDSLFLDRFVVALTHGMAWIPLYIMLGFLIVRNNKTMPQILLIFCCGILGVLFSGVLSDLVIKPLVMRPRPCFDPQWSELVQTVNGYNVKGYSFFSSHASNTFSLAIFFTLLVRSRLLGTTLILWSLFNGWTRIYLGVHWFTDVMTGFIWGAIVGVAMYFLYTYLYRRMSSGTKYISTHYTSTGYAHYDIYLTVLIVLLTVVYGILRAVIY